MREAGAGERAEGFDALVASAADAIVTSDDDGNVLSWNAAAERRIYCEPVGEIKVKGIAYPLRTYQVMAEREPEEALPPIDEEGEGFRLTLDATELSPGAAHRARHALRRALEVLDRVAAADEGDAMPLPDHEHGEVDGFEDR